MLTALAILIGPAGVASADPSIAPPFNECPPIGEDTGCGVLIVVNQDGTTSTLTDPNEGPYDGTDDTLVGVVNRSAATVQSLPLSGSDIFGFDDDGLCADDNAPAGCPFGPTGYEGPGTSFSADDSGDSGTVTFDGGLAPGSTAYFSLEGPTSSLVPTPPQVSTGNASAITQTSADVGGSVNPSGEDTTYYFEYGADTDYGTQTADADLSGTPSESGGPDRPVTATLDSLSPSTTYHYRLVATNADGTSYGDDQTFTTDAPPSATYVAFGDSYSSGEGLGPPWAHPRPACHRSSLGYPLLLVGALQIASDADLACTGATTNDFYAAQRDDHGSQLQPAQFDLAADQAGADTRLVTLTVGGDDLGFAPVLADCVAAYALSLPLGCKWKDKGRVAKRLAALRGEPAGHGAKTPKPQRSPIRSLTQVLGDIARRAPNATIVIGNYPHLFPAKVHGDCQTGTWDRHFGLGVLGADTRWLNSVGDQLNAAIKDAVDQARSQGLNVRLADAATAFKGHEIACGRKSNGSHWIQRLNVSSKVHIGWGQFDVQLADVDPGSFHPTREGQRAYEQAFLAQAR